MYEHWNREPLGYIVLLTNENILKYYITRKEDQVVDICLPLCAQRYADTYVDWQVGTKAI